MNIAFFGVKYNDSLNSLRKSLKRVATKFNARVDDSYFSTTTDVDRQNPAGVMKVILNTLKTNDVVIIEATDHSSGVGMIAGLAIADSIPLLVLYRENRDGNISANLAAASHDRKKVFLNEYNSSNLESIIGEFLQKSRNLVINKFYVELEPEHGKFLKWWSEFYHRPKVEFFRDSIEKARGRDKNWKKNV